MRTLCLVLVLFTSTANAEWEPNQQFIQGLQTWSNQMQGQNQDFQQRYNPPQTYCHTYPVYSFGEIVSYETRCEQRQ